MEPLLKGNAQYGPTTFSITTLGIKILIIKGLFVTLGIMTFSINDNQHNSTKSVIMLSVVVPSVQLTCLS